MQEIGFYRLEKLIENIEEVRLCEPCIIVGEPCEKLLALQKAGYCVVAELRQLQGLSDEETAEALCKEEAVMQYANVCIDTSRLSQAYLRRVWCKHKKEPVLIAETEHLLIRESVCQDAEAFVALYQDDACKKYLEPLAVAEESVEAYRRYIDQYQAGQYAFYEYGMWSVMEKKSGRCMGRAGLEQVSIKQASDLEEGAEVISLGYALLPEFRGKGYAVEACKAVLDYCLECEYTREVYVQIHEENEASLKVFENIQKIYKETVKRIENNR